MRVSLRRNKCSEVIKALPLLSAEERGEVSARLKALDALSPTNGAEPRASRARGASIAMEEVLGVIIAVVLQESGERVALAPLRKAVGGQALRVKAEELITFVEKHAGNNRARRGALLALGVRLLYRDLAKAGMTVTSRTLASCCHQIPAVLDHAFPGYAASGVLGMVVGQTISEEGIADGEQHGGRKGKQASTQMDRV